MAEQWILDLEEELQLPRNSPGQEQSIYRIPKFLTDINREAYEPMIASFGPFHHGRPHLYSMEQHKRRALIQYFCRIAKASKTPRDVFKAMSDQVDGLLASYDSLDNQDYQKEGHLRRIDWPKEKDEFLKLMITDSCFALEVMLAAVRPEVSDYDYYDPVFGTRNKNYFTPNLMRDMLLLENQLPLLALTTLAAIKGSEIEDVSTLIQDFYNLDLASPDDQMANKDLEVMTYEGQELVIEQDPKSNKQVTERMHWVLSSLIRTINRWLQYVHSLFVRSSLIRTINRRLQYVHSLFVRSSLIGTINRWLQYVHSLFVRSSLIRTINRWLQYVHSLFVRSQLKEPLEEQNEGSSHIVQNKGSSHILDLYKKIRTAKGEYLPSYGKKVNSATELKKAGVSFHKSESNSFGDITFKGGVLYLPKLEIDDNTKSILLNLIAFEDLHPTADNKVTNYVIFIDGLISTVDDVALLRNKDIISGMLGSDDDIAKIFNEITNGATRVDFLDDEQAVNVDRELNDYCEKRKHRWMASFAELYLKNPWVFFSLLGGLLLLGLTIVQTAYTIKQYYHA